LSSTISTKSGAVKGSVENADGPGFDGEEIHSAHGYLPDQFLTGDFITGTMASKQEWVEQHSIGELDDFARKFPTNLYRVYRRYNDSITSAYFS
jgi:hypothetical protein